MASGSPGSRERVVNQYGVEEIVTYVLRNWLVIGGVALLCVVAGVVWLKTRPLDYEARVTLLPEGGGGPGGLVGQLADIASFGAGGQGSLEEQYGKILVSDTVLDRLIARRWAGATGSDSLEVFALLGFEPEGVQENRGLAEFRLKQALRQKCIAFKTDKETGLMTIAVRMPGDAVIAADFANALVEQLRRFTREMHRSKYRDQHRYVAERLAEVEVQQEAAARAVAEFEQANRGFADSPGLVQQHGVLARELQAVTAVWIELRRQLEIARIEEAKDAVGPNILDPATPPALPSSPSLVVLIIVCGFLGAGLGVGVALARDVVVRLRNGDPA